MIKEICSKDNRIYKLCSKLAGKKYRDSLGAYLIEGPNLIEEAVAENAELQALVIRKGYREELLPVGMGSVTYVMDEKLFETVSQTDTSQGILAVVKKKEHSQEDFFKWCNERNGNILVLDRIQDPGNLGTMIRTADAAGYGGVMVLKGSGDVFSPKVVRAATGSLFRMPLLFVASPAEAAALIKQNDKKIISTCFDTDLYYYGVDLKKNIALVIGNEGQGICQELIELSDIKIKIPMWGSIDSLNASVAAGILMYEAMRK